MIRCAKSWLLPFASAALVVSVLGPALPVQAQEDNNLKTVFMGVKARRNVEPGLAAAMTDVVHGELITEARRQVFSQDDLFRVLELESDKQAAGCDSTSCLAEVASALDADRLINGTMDKIGSNYFIVLSEIDAQSIEPIARVQVKVPLEEDGLIEGVADATQQLLRKSARATGTTLAVTRPSNKDTRDDDNDGDDEDDEDEPDEPEGFGIALVTSEPPGIEVFYEGQSVGFTPVTLQDLPNGEAIVEAKLDDGDPVPISVPVGINETTTITARLNVPDTVTETEREDYEAASSSHSWLSYGLMGAGCVLCGSGLVGVLLSGVVGYVIGATGAAVTAVGAVLGIAGCASFVGGIGYLFFMGPEEPSISSEPVHAVLIQTADGDVEERDVEAYWKDEAAPETDTTPTVKKAGDADDTSDDGDDQGDDQGDDDGAGADEAAVDQETADEMRY